MPKIKDKVTAQFVTKIGKTAVVINLPVDLATSVASADNPDSAMDVLVEAAAAELQNLTQNAQLKLKNKAEFKKAFKAFAKANPPAAPAP